jgi:DNA adenine methylase
LLGFARVPQWLLPRTVRRMVTTLHSRSQLSPVSGQGLPIIKWVGGKARLLSAIFDHYDGQSRLVEPFLGGGAVSLALSGRQPMLEVIANDYLPELVQVYKAVAHDVEGFITKVEALAAPYLAQPDKRTRRAYYYEVRNRHEQSTHEEPAMLFFLLWTAYQGLFKTSTVTGQFKTAHGFGIERANFYHPDRLRANASLMQRWRLTSGDFASLLSGVNEDSFVYLDPPYRQTFGNYTCAGFDEADQLRVVEFARESAKKGATFVYSNKYQDDGFYEKNFAGFDIQRINVRHQVAPNAARVGRPKVAEVLITNDPRVCGRAPRRLVLP